VKLADPNVIDVETVEMPLMTDILIEGRVA
jgi:hypothetical protein